MPYSVQEVNYAFRGVALQTIMIFFVGQEDSSLVTDFLVVMLLWYFSNCNHATLTGESD